MIRINLLRERNPSQNSGGSGGLSGAASSVGGGALNAADIAVKVGLAFVPLVGVLVWEQYTLSQKLEAKTTKEVEAQKLKAEADELKPQIAAAKKLLEERKRLEQQIDTIRGLSKERLYNVKALSALQNIIPKLVWLSALKFDKEKVDFKGMSVDDASILDFNRRLGDSIYFDAMTLGGISDRSTSVDGSLKEFSISGKLEGM